MTDMLQNVIESSVTIFQNLTIFSLGIENEEKNKRAVKQSMYISYLLSKKNEL